jgi:hypothetical protein
VDQQYSGRAGRLAGGTPGTTWQLDEYYEKCRPAASPAQARDPELARQPWDGSAALPSITTVS